MHRLNGDAALAAAETLPPNIDRMFFGSDAMGKGMSPG